MWTSKLQISLGSHPCGFYWILIQRGHWSNIIQVLTGPNGSNTCADSTTLFSPSKCTGGCKPKLPDACQFPWTAWHNGAQVKVAQSRLTLCNPMDCTGHGILQARILEWVAFPSPGDLPNLAIKPRCPALQVDSLSAEPQGKPKNTGVCSLPLLQWIFLTQESNQGLPHCRQILYQLSYQRSPGKYYLITLVHSYNSIQS